MGGPIVNFELGYKSSITCASRCAVECQKAFFPCLSFHLKNFILPSIKSFVLVSIISSLYSTLKISLAREGLIFSAISNGVIPSS